MQKFDFSDMDDLYQEIILDHYRSPRNQEQLADADIETEGVNPFCGDEVYLRVKLNDGMVDAVSLREAGAPSARRQPPCSRRSSRAKA